MHYIFTFVQWIQKTQYRISDCICILWSCHCRSICCFVDKHCCLFNSGRFRWLCGCILDPNNSPSTQQKKNWRCFKLDRRCVVAKFLWWCCSNSNFIRNLLWHFQNNFDWSIQHKRIHKISIYFLLYYCWRCNICWNLCWNFQLMLTWFR